MILDSLNVIRKIWGEIWEPFRNMNHKVSLFIEKIYHSKLSAHKKLAFLLIESLVQWPPV